MNELLPPADNTFRVTSLERRGRPPSMGVAPVGAIGSYLYHVQHTHSLAPQPSGNEGGWDEDDQLYIYQR